MKSIKTADLLKVLGQQTPSSAVPDPKRTPPAVVSSSLKVKHQQAFNPPKPAPAPRRGRGVHLWFHEEDEKLIRELSLWLHTQRPRINDSLVIKAVLRAAKTGPALLAAYDEAVKIDGRKRQIK
jgi:hypothetical protein